MLKCWFGRRLRPFAGSAPALVPFVGRRRLCPNAGTTTAYVHKLFGASVAPQAPPAPPTEKVVY